MRFSLKQIPKGTFSGGISKEKIQKKFFRRTAKKIIKNPNNDLNGFQKKNLEEFQIK